MSELSDLVQKEIDSRENSPEKETIKNCPAALKDNIEHLMTYLFQENPWRNVIEKHRNLAAYHLITKIIQEIFSKQEKAFNVSNAYVRSLLSLWHKWEAAIISFNYDTTIERLAESYLRTKFSVESCGDDNSLDFTMVKLYVKEEMQDNLPEDCKLDQKQLSMIMPRPQNINEIFEFIAKEMRVSFSKEGEKDLINAAYKRLNCYIGVNDLYQIPIKHIRLRTQTLLSRDKTDTFRLLKLHGSINWYYSGNTEFSGELYFSHWKEGNFREKVEVDRNKKGLSPLIIPPVLDKSSFYAIRGIMDQWQEAKNSMVDANKIYVIGYSLPETDLAARFLFHEALSRKDSKLTVVIKGEEDGKAEAIRKRYLALLNSNDNRLDFSNLRKGEDSIGCLLEKIKE
ncbi:MAG: hypothetical protein HYS56_00950 [Candidatus Omnitrophica bacterium]|nr:hypothetical protein [Candidatus Omnitrophota bacterium]